MIWGVSAARAIASPRLASRTSPSRPASQIPAWVAWSAGRGKGAAIPATLPPREQKSNAIGRRIPPLCRDAVEGVALRRGAKAPETLARGQAGGRFGDLRDRLRSLGPAAHRHVERGRAHHFRAPRL